MTARKRKIVELSFCITFFYLECSILQQFYFEEEGNFYLTRTMCKSVICTSAENYT